MSTDDAAHVLFTLWKQTTGSFWLHEPLQFLDSHRPVSEVQTLPEIDNCLHIISNFKTLFVLFAGYHNVQAENL